MSAIAGPIWQTRATRSFEALSREPAGIANKNALERGSGCSTACKAFGHFAESIFVFVSQSDAAGTVLPRLAPCFEIRRHFEIDGDPSIT